MVDDGLGHGYWNLGCRNLGCRDLCLWGQLRTFFDKVEIGLCRKGNELDRWYRSICIRGVGVGLELNCLWTGTDSLL